MFAWRPACLAPLSASLPRCFARRLLDGDIDAVEEVGHGDHEKDITIFLTSRFDLDGVACAALQSRVFVSLSHRAGFPRHKDDEMRGKNVTGGQS